MTQEKHDPWALLREARETLHDFAENFDCDGDSHKYDTTCRACDAAKQRDRIDAALSSHDERDPFVAAYQRAFVNGCDVQIEMQRDGRWTWSVSRANTEPHALTDSVKTISRGPADSEASAKLLALRIAREAK